MNAVRRLAALCLCAAALVRAPPAARGADAAEDAAGSGGSSTAAEVPVDDGAAATADGVLATDAEAAQDAGAPDYAPGSLERETLPLDIRTASFLELAAWCRSLGISDAGTRTELERRLFDKYGIPYRSSTGSDAGSTASDAEGGAVLPSSSPRAGVGTGGGGSTSGQAAGATVTIESAQGVEYFTLEVSSEEYARFRGGVVISFVDGADRNTIQAGELLYNRTRGTISAKGGVVYTRESSGSVERFVGESLSVHTDDWTGVFMDGSSDLSKKSADQGYRFSGALISRSAEGVTVLDGAVVTTAQSGDEDADPYWSLSASKIWLLPGSEWAVANAVLRVGEVPIFYLPFFYLPGDEALFHPVVGYRSREGFFVQTTTYLIGQPKKQESDSSILSILDVGGESARKRDGLFLRKTGEAAAEDGGTTLSLLFDAYSDLGAYLGLDFGQKKVGPLGETSISAGVAASRDLYYDSSTGYYSPFDSSGATNWNSSVLFGVELPLRYRLAASSSLNFSGGSLSLSLPIYSDSFVDRDFLDRSESMDWLGAVTGSDSTSSSTPSLVTSFLWKASFSLTPELSGVKPYLSNLSVSSAYSSLAFSSKILSSYSDTDYSPEDRFFYPSKLTLLSLAATLSGTPVGGSAAAAEKAKAGATDATAGLRSPWPAAAEADRPASVEGGKFTLPSLSQTFTPQLGSSGTKFSLSYSLSPSVVAEAPFLSSGWSDSTEVDWSSFSSLAVAATGTGSTTAKLASSDDAYSAAFTLTGNTKWSAYPYLNEEDSSYDTVAEREAKVEDAYTATYFKTTGSADLTAKPFSSNSPLASSSFEYKATALIAKSVFDGTASDPDWNIVYGDWSEDSFQTHSLSAAFKASIRDQAESLTFTAQLPPLDSTLQIASSVQAGPTTTAFSFKATDLDDTPSADPISFSETITLGNSSTLKAQTVYDPEEPGFTTFSTSLALGDFSVSFSAKESSSYSFDTTEGWVADTDSEAFRPQRLDLSWTPKQDQRRAWKNRVVFSGSASSALKLDFLRFTESSFTFAADFSLKVNEFLDLSFSSSSQNAQVYKYLLGLPLFTLPDSVLADFSGERNVFVDLLKSFNFWNDADRRSSGFKLKALSFGAVHYLGDWTATLDYSVSPYLDTDSSPPVYRFSDEISFTVQWTPVKEFKTGFTKDSDGFDFES